MNTLKGESSHQSLRTKLPRFIKLLKINFRKQSAVVLSLNTKSNSKNISFVFLNKATLNETEFIYCLQHYMTSIFETLNFLPDVICRRIER